MNPAIKRGLIGVSLAGAALIAGYEGLEKTAYKDPVGIVTICYGHTATAKLGQTRTQDQCWGLLQQDAKIASDAVLKHVKTPITQDELDAYTSFTYNVGAGNFASSTLLKKLNKGDRVGACQELTKWVYAKGKKLQGLVNRRAGEMALCLKGARSNA